MEKEKGNKNTMLCRAINQIIISSVTKSLKYIVNSLLNVCVL